MTMPTPHNAHSRRSRVGSATIARYPAAASACSCSSTPESVPRLPASCFAVRDECAIPPPSRIGKEPVPKPVWLIGKGHSWLGVSEEGTGDEPGGGIGQYGGFEHHELVAAGA